ncbi:MAG: CCA tRNA nucleotidyltransferase [Eubacteriales bacterium]|jgi:tRNA nucleotidyltransferase (CCA-adding enzyme)|nr:CCA tRNA nucleotidyltransferase [Eubacteriales bacterium]
MKILIPKDLLPLAEAFAKENTEVFVVGGLVRNALLNLPPSDIDVCSRLTPQEIVEIMPRHNIRVIEKAAEMGTVELHFHGVIVEHTTFRREAYADGGEHRPRTVAFSESLTDDAWRRDFSVNALYANLATGEVIDPTGGIADLKRQLIRTTSADPDDILHSDALRVLRLVRFACELGFAIDEGAWAAAKRNAPKLIDIAAERRRQEFVKILLTDARYPDLSRDELRSPMRGLQLLDELDVWDFLVPEFNLARGMEQRPDHHRYDVLEHSFRVCAAAPPTEKLRLAALLHDVGKPNCKQETGVQYAHDKYGERISKRVLGDLRFPTRMITEVSQLVEGHMYDIQHMAKTDTLRVKFATWGRERTMEQIQLREADVRGCGYDVDYVATDWRALLNTMLHDGTPFSERELAITGQELMAASGLPGGKEFGELKKKLFLHCVKHPKDNNLVRLTQLAKKS